MSNNNHGVNNGANGTQNPNGGGSQPNGGQKKNRRSCRQWLSDTKAAFMSKPAGRWTVRVLKGAGYAGVGALGFYAGRRTAKPKALLTVKFGEDTVVEDREVAIKEDNPEDTAQDEE